MTPHTLEIIGEEVNAYIALNGTEEIDGIAEDMVLEAVVKQLNRTPDPAEVADLQAEIAKQLQAYKEE